MLTAAELAVQSIGDRLDGLLADVERTSAQLWVSGERITATRLEHLANLLADAKRQTLH